MLLVNTLKALSHILFVFWPLNINYFLKHSAQSSFLSYNFVTYSNFLYFLCSAKDLTISNAVCKSYSELAYNICFTEQYSSCLAFNKIPVFAFHRNLSVACNTWKIYSNKCARGNTVWKLFLFAELSSDIIIFGPKMPLP